MSIAADNKLAGLILSAPLGCAALLLQTQHDIEGAETEPYTGTWSLLTQVAKEQGWNWMYRSAPVELARGLPSRMLEAAVMEQVEEGHKLAGSLVAGTLTVFLFSPVDVIATKYRLSGARGSPPSWSTPQDKLSQLVGSNGIGVLFTAIGASLAGMAVYRCTSALLHAVLDPMVEVGPTDSPTKKGKKNDGDDGDDDADDDDDDEKPSMDLGVLALGLGISVVAGFVAYPMSTVRARMMAAVGTRRQYASSLECFRHIVDKDGLSGLYAGSGASALATLASGLVSSLIFHAV